MTVAGAQRDRCLVQREPRGRALRSRWLTAPPLLAAELTAAHFGGGELPQQRPSRQAGAEAERPRSRKELIEELIAKSKLEKVRRPAWEGPRHALGSGFPAGSLRPCCLSIDSGCFAAGRVALLVGGVSGL